MVDIRRIARKPKLEGEDDVDDDTKEEIEDADIVPDGQCFAGM
jgi:hypothetical protein